MKSHFSTLSVRSLRPDIYEYLILNVYAKDQKAYGSYHGDTVKPHMMTVEHSLSYHKEFLNKH